MLQYAHLDFSVFFSCVADVVSRHRTRPTVIGANCRADCLYFFVAATEYFLMHNELFSDK